MPDFEDLNIHADGVGRYHLNRFRAYFRIPNQEPSKDHKFGQDLRTNFAKYFDSDLAKVSKVKEHSRFGRATFRFNARASLFNKTHWITDIMIPDVHNDWVGVLRETEAGMTVQTLKRGFMTGYDFAAGTMAGGGAMVVAPLMGTLALVAAPVTAHVAAVQINQHHFLAGRRAWHVGPATDFGVTVEDDEKDGELFAIETVAIERLSGRVVEAVGAAQLIGNMDLLIRDIWIGLVTQYIRTRSFSLVSRPEFSDQLNNASYIMKSFDNRQKLEENTHFSQITNLYEDLYPANSA